MTIDRILSLIAVIVSFGAVPASGYLSYKYAVIGERRKEFNAVADTIRQKLREHRRHLEEGIYPSGQYIAITQHNYDSLVDVSPADSKALVKRLSDVYQQAIENSIELNDYGEYSIVDLSFALLALDQLMPYVARK